MIWFVCVSASLLGAGLFTGCLVYLLGSHFLKEFTRPGVTVEPGTPLWGGWTFPEGVSEPAQERQRTVTFRTSDGLLLQGEFWAQQQQAPTIILSHGFHLPSCHFRSVAALEYAHGANVFLFDYRGHGTSSFSPTTCGNAEVNDLLAAVNIVVDQPETASHQVYIHGFSMGAAVALLLPQHASIAGIIADSPYASLYEMIYVLIVQLLSQQTLRWPGPLKAVRLLFPALAHLMLLGGRLLFHARHRFPLIARPEHSIGKRLEKTSSSVQPPILLIHAENDPLIALHHAHRLAARALIAGRVIQVYYTPCAVHCGSYGHDPQRYMALLRAFVML